MVFSSNVEAKAKGSAEELSGKLGSSTEEDKLMKTVLPSDKKEIDDGQVIADGINRNIGAFTPDMMYSSMVNNFSLAKQLFGERILRLLSGYSINSLEKNIKIPEFSAELLKNLHSNIKRMKESGLINKSGAIVEQGEALATYIMYIDELDKLKPHGFQGEIENKKKSFQGEKQDTTPWRKGHYYKDVDIRRSISQAIKRRRIKLKPQDLYITERHSKGTAYIIFGMDSSASMRGKKIEMAKKAGIALAYKAYLKKDKIGLVVFGSNIKDYVTPTDDFTALIKKIATVRTSRETEFVNMFKKTIELFPDKDCIKHLILLTDALPTKGNNPLAETLKAVYRAKSHGITVSVVGIRLDEKGTKMAHDIAQAGEGRMISVQNLDSMDTIVLEDYEAAISN